MKAESQKRCLKPGHVQSREFLKFLKPAREGLWPPGSETARTRAIPDAPNKSYEFCVGERLLISYTIRATTGWEPGPLLAKRIYLK